MKLLRLLVVFSVMMMSCGKNIPDDIIQPKQMENLLYDYHLLIGMSHNMKNVDMDACRQFIFQKYHVSDSIFDKSMKWYARDAKELSEIYGRLNNRFNQEYNQIEKLMESRQDSERRITPSGDSVDIWRKSEIFYLSDASLMDKVVFEIKSDTTFYKNDSFLWNMDVFFMTNSELELLFNVILENDSVIAGNQTITRSGNYSISLFTDSTSCPKELNGFIYVPKDSVENTRVLIHNVRLMRYHKNSVGEKMPDLNHVRKIF